MTDLERRLDEWTDLVARLLRCPEGPDFPRGPVEAMLLATFGGVVSWNWRDRDGRGEFDLAGALTRSDLSEESVTAWVRRGLDDHPLLRWFTRTGSSTPMTVGRVPRALVPAASFAFVREQLEPLSCEQQLAVPLRLRGVEHRAYVLARGREDFTDQELLMAVRIQPLLQLVDRQTEVLRDRRGPASCGLTGREQAILVLLADGLTAATIGRRLGVSARTVHKHLEHVYRKLAVGDRLRAVAVARDAGILAGAERGPGPHCSPTASVSSARG